MWYGVARNTVTGTKDSVHEGFDFGVIVACSNRFAAYHVTDYWRPLLPTAQHLIESTFSAESHVFLCHPRVFIIQNDSQIPHFYLLKL